MELSNLSSAQLAQLIRLVKEKENLQQQLERVESALAGIGGRRSPGRPRGRRPGRPAKAKPVGRPPGRKGRLKESLLKILKSAGSEGITVKELAAKLKVKPNNVFSWFYTTGKKVSGIKKVGEARYALHG
jgi:hypothetical protein